MLPQLLMILTELVVVYLSCNTCFAPVLSNSVSRVLEVRYTKFTELYFELFTKVFLSFVFIVSLCFELVCQEVVLVWKLKQAKSLTFDEGPTVYDCLNYYLPTVLSKVRNEEIFLYAEKLYNHTINRSWVRKKINCWPNEDITLDNVDFKCFKYLQACEEFSSHLHLLK